MVRQKTLTLALTLLHIHLVYLTITDNRLTIIKPGYGINFNLEGKVLGDGESAIYHHTYAVQRLTIQPEKIPSFDCKDSQWKSLCSALTDILETTNIYGFESLSLSTNLLYDGDDIILPSLSNVKIDISEERLRRSAEFFARAPVYEEIWNPFASLESALSKLTGIAGPSQIKAMENHIRAMAAGIHENDEGIKMFNKYISSFSSLTNKGIDNLYRLLSLSHTGLEKVITEMAVINNKTLDFEKEAYNRMQFLIGIDAIFMEKFLPAINKYYTTIRKIGSEVKNWIEGIITLSKGYLSPFLVPEKKIYELIHHISNKILTLPLYSDLMLPSLSPNYYYNLKNIAYSHRFNNNIDDKNGSTIYITISIPLHRTGGFLPIYSLEIYPVPSKAGILKKENGLDGYTKLSDMPDYIAVDSNHELYMEINKKQYLSCEGDHETKICGTGMPLLKKRRAGDVTCAFALFIEDSTEVLRKCKFLYSETNESKLRGSAIQLMADHSFLLHASQVNREGDKWSLSCPMSKTNPQPKINVCDMCKIAIPCYCLLTTREYLVPPRYTGCSMLDETSEQPITYLYHINTPIIQTLFSDSDEANYVSYLNHTKLLNPSFKIPDIEFQVADNISRYISVSNEFSASLKKTLSAQAKNLTIYKDKVDAALVKARNFSDVVKEKTLGLTDLINGIRSIFGNDFFKASGLIFSPQGFCFIAFVIAAVQFVPGRAGDFYSCLRRIQAKRSFRYYNKQYESQELLVNSFNDEDLY